MLTRTLAQLLVLTLSLLLHVWGGLACWQQHPLLLLLPCVAALHPYPQQASHPS
jgi:hypothetical protein